MPVKAVAVWLTGEIEAELLRALNERSSMFQVTHRCADLVELRAAVDAQATDIVITDADLPGIDATFIDQVHKRDVFVLLTCEDALRHHVIGEDTWCERNAEEIVETLIKGLRRQLAGESSYSPKVVETKQETERGKLIVVWGTDGAPGRSTIAFNLATQLSETKDSVVLIDADTSAPSLLLMSGNPIDASGVMRAVALRNRGQLDAEELHEIAVPLSEKLFLLSGLTKADKWRQLTAEAALDIIEVARQLGDVVVDLGAGFTDDDPAALTFVPKPEDLNLDVARAADAVILVARADAIGLSRLQSMIGDCEEHSVQIHAIVLNQASDASCGSSSRASLHAIMGSIAAENHPYIIIEREAAVEEALLASCPVIVLDEESKFVGQIYTLLKQLPQILGEEHIPRRLKPTSWFNALRNFWRRRTHPSAAESPTESSENTIKDLSVEQNSEAEVEIPDETSAIALPSTLPRRADRHKKNKS